MRRISEPSSPPPSSEPVSLPASIHNSFKHSVFHSQSLTEPYASRLSLSASRNRHCAPSEVAHPPSLAVSPNRCHLRVAHPLQPPTHKSRHHPPSWPPQIDGTSESHLHPPSWRDDSNSYSVTRYARRRASLVHHYLTSWVVAVSTIGAFLALYFTSIQTVCSFADALEALKTKSFRSLLLDAFCIPVLGTPIINKEGENSNSEDAAKLEM
ncbi:hypothetical protein Fmac_015697 [Flemingia macrophylla]|uniref:Uncharacterized protein n=1 Tax=Flemingia macrophylla TaxID=520843 RepID=A0ABD1MF99_9FABA